MARKCEQCSAPALDDLSEYCNRCGGRVIEEPRSKVPVCVRCGNPAPNNEVLYCNRCGTEYPPIEPEITCPRCGNAIPDELSEFCNRCGSPVKGEPEPEMPVCPKCSNPATDAAALFCNRCGTSYQKELENIIPHCQRCGHLAASQKKKYAHLPLVVDDLAGGKIRDESIVIPGNSKKYGHLPLVADEFREKQSPRLEIESPYYPGPPKETKAGKPKKGFFDLLKK